jgi:hypothetical protein
MKRILFLLLGLALFTAADAQVQTVVQWPFGAANIQGTATIDADSTCDLTVSNRLTYVPLGTVTGMDSLFVTVTATAPTGSYLYVYATISNTGGTVFKCSSGCTMLPTTLATAQTHLLEFFYNGTTYLLVGTQRVQ